MFEDRVLSCKDCGREFVFSVREQEFYAEKGFENDPLRCPECRAARKSRRNEGGYGGGGYNQFGRAPRAPRQMYEATCAECGNLTEVPFKPKEDRPVYCDNCFKQRKHIY
ncbi:MAG: zinc-ribbon domain containing protein [Eubacteriales bacterium]